MSARPDVLAPTLIESLFVGFHRLLAAYCLFFGLLYWVRLVGVYPGDLWRFDLMPVHWQVASVILAVFFPFAAVGLWMLAAWGAVVWFICAAGEVYMYWFRSDLFGSRPAILAAHLVMAAVYFGLLAFVRSRRKSAWGPANYT